MPLCNGSTMCRLGEALLEHIRRMRAGPPAPPPLTEAMRKRLEEEQEAGRRALAIHQARGR
jgi:hypothetical protein